MNWTELLGYFASALILISLLFTSLIKFRTVNAIGSVLFVVFALLITSYPTALMNLGIVIIDVYYLYKILNIKDNFALVQANKNVPYFKHFVARHYDDLSILDGEDNYLEADVLMYYVRNDEIAGLLAYNRTGENEVEILLDYVTPQFRDAKVGKFFFGGQSSYFKKQGINRFTTRSFNKSHEKYLQKLQFKPQPNGIWAKEAM